MAKERKNTDHKYICENLNYASREAFKRLRTNLLAGFPAESGCKVIGVTSAEPSDGKSTISLNLAFSLCELDARVLLLNADLRRPSLHDRLGLERSPGLSHLLAKTETLSTAVQKYVSLTDERSFDFIASGDEVPNPAEQLTGKRMGALIRTLTTAYDYVVIDLPPVSAVVDAVAVSQYTDGILVVVRENTCPHSLLDDCLEQLNRSKVNILGFVVNGALEGAGKKYRYNSRDYSYGSKYYGNYYR